MKKFILSIILILSTLFGLFFLGGYFFTGYSLNQKIDEIKNSVKVNKNYSHNFSASQKESLLAQKFFSVTELDSSFLPNYATIKFNGNLKTETNSKWKPIETSAYVNLQEPNYLWFSEMEKENLFSVKTIESYHNGKGNVLIKLGSSITIGDSWGVEIDKSNLFRYLSLAVYYPFKLFPNENLIWNELDTNLIEIKLKDSETSIVAKLFFNEDNLISKIETKDKYKAVYNNYEESLYTIHFSNYKTLENGFTVPTHFELEWSLSLGKFKYGIFDLIEIEYENI